MKFTQTEEYVAGGEAFDAFEETAFEWKARVTKQTNGTWWWRVQDLTRGGGTQSCANTKSEAMEACRRWLGLEQE